MRPLRTPLLSALAGILLLGACAAQAMSIRELRTLEADDKDNGKLLGSYYLVGVMEGIRHASESAQRRGQAATFCVEGRRLEPAMARPLYQSELSRHADLYEADMPVELVMEAALQASYRCTR
jgi:hypothetical protein